MEKNGFKYGVVVDADGYFVSALRWKADTPRPQLNKKGAQKFWLLISEEAVNNVQPNGRWNKVKGDWDFPTQMYYVVNERGGVLSGSKQWPERLKGIGPKEEYVTVAPPVSRARKPIWTGKKWEFPRRAGLLNTDTGVLESIQLENPRTDQPNVIAPKGYKKVTEKKWPVDADGDTVGIGHVLKDGVWMKPGAHDV